jgi:WD40 repeat protein
MIHVWDTSSPGAQPTSWSTGDDGVWRLAFSPDGARLLSLKWRSAELRTWNVASEWTAGSPIDVRQGAEGFALSADGTKLAVVGERLELLSGDGATHLATVEDVSPRCAEFAHSSRFLAAVEASKVYLVDAATGLRMHALVDADEPGVPFGESVCFTPDDGCVLAVGEDGAIRAWDTASGTLIHRVPVNQIHWRAIAVSPHGDRFAAGTKSHTEIFELRTPAVMRTLAHSAAPLLGADWLAGSDRFVTTSLVSQGDMRQDHITSWDAATGTVVSDTFVVGAPDERWSARSLTGEGLLAAHPRDASAVVTARHFGAAVHTPDAYSASCLRTLNWPTMADVVDVPETGLGIAGEDDPLAFDGRAGRIGAPGGPAELRLPLKSLALPSAVNWWHIVAVLRVSGVPPDRPAFILQFDCNEDARDAELVVPADRLRTGDYQPVWLDHLHCADVLRPVHRYDLILRLSADAPPGQEIWVDRLLLIPSGRSAADVKRTEPLGPFSFSPQGERLWGLFDQQTLISWDYATLAARSQWSDATAEIILGDDVLYSLAAGEHTTAVGARRGVVYLFSTDGSSPRSVVDGPGGAVRAVSIDPAGRLLAAGGELGRIQLTELPAGTIKCQLDGHSRSVETLTFSPEGDMLASGSKDKAARLWRKSGPAYEAVLTLGGLSGSVRSLRFNADGTRLLVLIDGETAVRIWDIQKLRGQLAVTRVDW